MNIKANINEVEGPGNDEMHQVSPWIMSIDNIFLDVAVNLPDNKFLEDNDIIPGTQNTALDDKMKQVARQLFIMTNGEYGSKQISKTVGGCAMNTSRAANFYLQAQFGTESSLVYTLGCVGKDSAGT